MEAQEGLAKFSALTKGMQFWREKHSFVQSWLCGSKCRRLPQGCVAQAMGVVPCCRRKPETYTRLFIAYNQ